MKSAILIALLWLPSRLMLWAIQLYGLTCCGPDVRRWFGVIEKLDNKL